LAVVIPKVRWVDALALDVSTVGSRETLATPADPVDEDEREKHRDDEQSDSATHHIHDVTDEIVAGLPVNATTSR
jgi:hypothetical protein